MAKYKIWWQSSTQLDLLPGYKEAIEEHASHILSPDFELEMHGVETSSNLVQYSYFELLNGRDMMENFFRAQEQGFDAIAIGCFSDPCLREAREALDIPVVSIAQNAMLWAKLYGDSASIITTDEVVTTKKFAALVREYGCGDFLLPFTKCYMTLEEMASALVEPEAAMARYQAACAEAVAAGAEVIIPGCGLLAALSARTHYHQVGDTGAVILDVAGALMKTAEAAVTLHRVSGMMTSRNGTYRKPDNQVIWQVREHYGLL